MWKCVGVGSDYRDVPHGVYRYAAYKLEANGKTIEQPVIDWVGEEPMDGTAFTYTIVVNPAGRNFDIVRLTNVTTDQ